MINMVKHRGSRPKAVSNKQNQVTLQESNLVLPEFNNPHHFPSLPQNGHAINGSGVEDELSSNPSTFENVNGSNMSDISSADSSLISSESGNNSTLSSMTENSQFSVEKANISPNNGMITSEKKNTSLKERIDDLLKRTKYTIVPRNGQRIYGGPPPDWKGSYPAKGSEIFVGKVPHDILEDELVPIFEQVGKIYELRLMMNFSNENRGYFFVCYTCPEDAKRAIKELNNYEIRPGKPLGVIHSVDNRKLWISGIPKNRSPSEIKTEMEKLTDGVKDIILYPSLIDKSKTRGYAFVEYESHRAAALARRELVRRKIILCGQEVEKIDWAEPENEVDEEIMAKVRILFIRNLMGCTSEDQITKVFNKLCCGQVERVKKTKDYAFVHFTSRDAAEKALLGISKSGNYLKIDGAEVEVTWSKPVDKYAYNTRKLLTKALTAGSSSNNGNANLIDGNDPQFSQNLIQEGIINPHLNHMNNNVIWQGPIAPRGRGAAGVKGLGAPGTAPPKNLVKRIIGNGNLVDNKGQFLIPYNVVPYPFAPFGYAINNQTPSLQNSNSCHQQFQQSWVTYTDQYVKALNDLKQTGGTSYYPYVFNSTQTPENGALNNQISSNAHSGGSSTASDVNTDSGSNTNINTTYTPVGVPISFPPFPGGYAWPNIYHTNHMIAAAYNGQCLPISTELHRSQQFQVSSQNQTTPSIQPAFVPNSTTTEHNSTNNHRYYKTRNLQKQVKSH